MSAAGKHHWKEESRKQGKLKDGSVATHKYQHIKRVLLQKSPGTAKFSGSHRPAHLGDRFSRNAAVPSVLSPVPQSRPNISASTCTASSIPSWLPRSTA